MSNQIYQDLADLHAVLLYCSEQQSYGRPACFTILERICINQERGALLSQCNEENRHHDVRFYKCPVKLESKIKFVLKKIIDNN